MHGNDRSDISLRDRDLYIESSWGCKFSPKGDFIWLKSPSFKNSYSGFICILSGDELKQVLEESVEFHKGLLIKVRQLGRVGGDKSNVQERRNLGDGA